MRIFTLKWVRGAVQRPAGVNFADPRFLRFPDIRPLFERELRRARRYGRPVTVIIVGLIPVVQRGVQATGNGGSRGSVVHDADIDRQRRWREPIIKLGELLESSIRETDLFAYVANTSEFVALLPEADASAAQFALTRIRQQWRPVEEFTLEVGAASFPVEALLFDDLLKAAQRARSAVPNMTNAHPSGRRDAAHA